MVALRTHGEGRFPEPDPRSLAVVQALVAMCRTAGLSDAEIMDRVIDVVQAGLPSETLDERQRKGLESVWRRALGLEPVDD